MRHCGNCGASVEEDATVCSNCGVELQHPGERLGRNNGQRGAETVGEQSPTDQPGAVGSESDYGTGQESTPPPATEGQPTGQQQGPGQEPPPDQKPPDNRRRTLLQLGAGAVLGGGLVYAFLSDDVTAPVLEGDESGVSEDGDDDVTGAGEDGGSDGSGTGGENSDLPPTVVSEVEDYLEDATNYRGIIDRRGIDIEDINVGCCDGWGFATTAIRVDPGTRVIWEWTGHGGGHNVVDENGKFESDLTDKQGHTFEVTFESDGTHRYYCAPHKGTGMKGAVVVGSGVGGGAVTVRGDGSGADETNGSDIPGEVEAYLSDANEFTGVADGTGMNETPIQVGAGESGLAFGPSAVRVDPGTTVVWEWTGEGGSHNVIDEDGGFESELVAEAGHTFEQQFDESGVVLYYCQPHKSVGMKGAIIVE